MTPPHIPGAEINAQAALVAARAAMITQQYRKAYDLFSTVVELGRGNAVKLQVP